MYRTLFKKNKEKTTQVNKTCVVITHSDNKYTTVRLFLTSITVNNDFIVVDWLIKLQNKLPTYE